MKDFLGSFADGPGRLARSFLFPAVVAVALWSFSILRTASQDGTVYGTLSNITEANRLLVLAGSALALALALGVATPAATRVLEGYWFGRHHAKGPLRWIWISRIRSSHGKRKRAIKQLNQLHFEPIPAGSDRDATRVRNAQISRAQEQYRRYPKYPTPVMPTRLGNVLKASETSGSRQYGIDTVSLWDRLTAVAPAHLVAVDEARRAQLDMWVSVVVLGALFPFTTIHAVATTDLDAIHFVLAAGAGTLVSAVGYLAAVQAAKSYSDNITALVELARFPLADALGLTIPAEVREERRLWEAISAFHFWGDEDSPEGEKRRGVIEAARIDFDASRK